MFPKWIFITNIITYLFLAALCWPNDRKLDADVFVPSTIELDNASFLKSETRAYYMNEICAKNISLIQLKNLQAVRISPWTPRYPPSRTVCVVGVESFAYQNFRLVLTFKTLQLSPANSFGKCEESRLDVFSGRTASPSDEISGQDGICGKHAGKKDYTTSNNVMIMRYSTFHLPKNTYQYFEAVITPYHTGKCRSEDFKCTNDHCILTTLMCDGYNNCGDDSDEKSCSSSALSLAAIIGIAVGSVVFIGIIIGIATCVCCCGKCGYEKL